MAVLVSVAASVGLATGAAGSILADAAASSSSVTPIVVSIGVGVATIVLGGLVMRWLGQIDSRREHAEERREKAEQEIQRRIARLERRLQQLREALIAAVPASRQWITGFEAADAEVDRTHQEGD